jgi:serine/threonine-protein kinase
MGEVYRARDVKLGRDVAIKILPPLLAADPDRLVRFDREARLLAALNHPHIAAIYGLEEHDGIPALVLELVDGETLADRVRRGPVPIPEALAIARQVADALEAAHEKDIVHRDLKPGNIIIAREGTVKVLDFGLAKAGSDAVTPDGTQSPTVPVGATREGVLLGTAAYMSPEQTRRKALGKRTDIWAFGCVLYETLTGKAAFGGDTVSDTIAAILDREPDWRALPSATPSSITRMLQRCLEKDPNRRLHDIADARIEIDDALVAPVRPAAAEALPPAVPAVAPKPWWTGKAAFSVGGLALVALLALGTWFNVSRGRGEAIDSLAVLPFVNVSADASAEYLSDGITEAIINSLSQLPHLAVKSRNVVMLYKGRETDIQGIGRDLAVQAVLTGRLIQRGEVLSISIELIDARNNNHVWGEQYSRKLADLLSLQEDISKEVTEKLRLRLSGEQNEALSKRPTQNTEAYQLYLKGRYFWNKRTAEGFKSGIAHFQQAIEKDPNYALAYAGLADCYNVLGFFGQDPPRETYTKGKAAATKALELDEKLAEAHASLGYDRFFYDWDWLGARREYERALAGC